MYTQCTVLHTLGTYRNGGRFSLVLVWVFVACCDELARFFSPWFFTLIRRFCMINTIVGHVYGFNQISHTTSDSTLMSVLYMYMYRVYPTCMHKGWSDQLYVCCASAQKLPGVETRHFSDFYNESIDNSKKLDILCFELLVRPMSVKNSAFLLATTPTARHDIVVSANRRTEPLFYPLCMRVGVTNIM